jgi:tetratricopeptide (TPR) repeat protein
VETQKLPANRLQWRQKLDSERDNLRAAIEWALERKPDLALEMVGDEAYFWSEYGYAAEGLRWLEEGIEKCTRLPDEPGENTARRKAVLANAHWGKAIILGTLGVTPRIVAALEESVRLWREVGDLRRLSNALSLLGFWGTFLEFPNRYRSQAEEGLALGRQLHNAEAIGAALAALGREMLFFVGDYAQAQAYFKEAAEVQLRSGENYFYSLSLISLGFSALNQGDLPTARSKFSRSLAVFQEYGDLHFSNVARSGLAETARQEKDFSQAIRLYLETITAWQEFGNLGAIARCLECLAFIAGDLAQTQTGPAERQTLLRCAGVLLGAAETLRESSGSAMTHEERLEYDQRVPVVQSLAPQEVFKDGWLQGRETKVYPAKAVGEGLLGFVS